MTTNNAVLISWIAFNNDPFERQRESRSYRLVDSSPVPGPTLNLLFSEESPLRGAVKDVVLLYPSPADNILMSMMEPGIKERLHSLKHDLLYRQDAPLGCIPVSPWDLGSVERLARVLRWALFSSLYKSFPQRVKKPHGDFANIATAKWLVDDGYGHVTLIRPPSELEERQFNIVKATEAARMEIQRLEVEHESVSLALREAARQRTKTELLVKQKAALNKQITEAKEKESASGKFVETIKMHIEIARAILVCPVCGTTIESPISPASAVSRHFECECPSCSSKWGNRTCGHCHASFPVIVLKESENRSPERSNEWVDRKFGQDVFATPCVNNQGKWAFICPECNRCT